MRIASASLMRTQSQRLAAAAPQWPDPAQWPIREWVAEAVQTLRELPDWGLLGVLFGAALLGGGLLLQMAAMVRWLRTWRSRRLGAWGEQAALSLLAGAGYRVVARQTTRRYRVRVDGASCEVELRADFVVERKGETFVAEVKGGPVVCDPLHTPTRRQLLEYEVAFEVEGVLLVDVPGRRIRRVAFPLAD
jgi:hypothetical protein